MLIWLLLIPVIAAACIGLLKMPGKTTALISATLTLILGAVALVCASCPCCESSECTQSFCVSQLTLTPLLSRIMVALTLIVTFAAILGLKAPNKDAERSWAISALLLSTGALGAFMSDSIIAFYGFHELALIPTFIMIGCYGRGDRRTIAWRATVYLGVASMVLLAGLVLLCAEMHAWTFSTLQAAAMNGVMPTHPCLIAGLLLAGFGALISLFPFHSWAAPAYASAPTPIAMLHAGVLKKFGLYGLFTIAMAFGGNCGQLFGGWNNLLLVLLLGNVLWVGYVTVAQTRLDDMLGNSSVMHMGYIFLAFAAFISSNGVNDLAVNGAAMLMLAHGLSIALLFLLTGQIEAQTKTLELDSMGGLARKLPLLGFFFGLAGLASIGLPLLANFAGEFTIFMSCLTGWTPTPVDCGCILGSIANFFGGLGPVQLALIFALWGLVISAVYMLRAFRNIFEAEVGHASERATKLSCTDIAAAGFLVFFIVIFGIMPQLIFAL